MVPATPQGAPEISAIDLFCGVGGLTHGLLRSGVTVHTGIDIDPECKYPYESNNGAAFLQRDIADLSAAELEGFFAEGAHRLLAGCAPCQPFSTYSRSGRSKKRTGEWQLVSSFGRLVADMQPELVTMENVSQLTDHEVFDVFLEALKGYEVNWSIVECATYGVPQSRRRLVLLASRLGSVGLEMPKRSDRYTTVREIISDLPPIAAGGQDPDDPLHAASSLSSLNLQRIRASSPGGTWRDWDPDLQASCHRRKSGATYPSVYGRMEWDRIAPTITTQFYGYGNGRFGHPEQDRAISVREAAMLQTFPRSYAFVAPGQAVRFNRLGRLIGNAVPVRLGEVIGEVLLGHLRHYLDSRPPC
jgi:DNA (cytosine-5)-methyltransferase 1